MKRLLALTISALPILQSHAATAVAESTSRPTSNVEWTGVTPAMWGEIKTQRENFGDPNDCQARVVAIPASGGVTLKPGANIAAALQTNDIIFLSGGTYMPDGRIPLPPGKKLIGLPGQTVTLNMANADIGVSVDGNGTVLANVAIEGAQRHGVDVYGFGNGLIYQVAVRKTGYNVRLDTGSGIFLSGYAFNNCIVSADVSDTWNELGAPNDHGGNADGINNTFGAHHNTFIDVHSYRNGDDNIDMWKGGVAYFYFSDSHDAGKVAGKGQPQGDGNGIKLGGAGDNVSHKFYKTTARNNSVNGFDINNNLAQPVLLKSGASGNARNYVGVLAP